MPLNHKGTGEYSVKVCTYEILFLMRTALLLLFLFILEIIQKHLYTESTYSADVIRNPLKPLYFPSYHLAQKSCNTLTFDSWSTVLSCVTGITVGSVFFPSMPENKNAVTPLMVLILGTGGLSYLSHLSNCISTYSSIRNIFQFTSWNGRNEV